MNQVALSIASAKDPAPARREVSVVMVVYRTGEALEKAIRCVLEEPNVDELIIVDNGSTEAAAESLRELARIEPRVSLLQGHGNVGFARGANMGAAAARGRHVVFLNPDAFLQPGCVDALTAGLEGQPPRSIVGACILDPDGAEQRGGRRGEVSALSTLLTLSRASRRIPGLDAFEIHRNHEAMPTGMVTMPTISGACFAVRREDFQVIGGFDEGYFLHVEDIDLCWRARKQGGAVLFHPSAKVVHLGHTSNSSPWRVEMHKAMGLIRYFLKRAESAPSYLLALLLSPLIMITALARPVLWQMRGRRA
jgi:N-acetylglucosaminyl-diphospho-decaprenol L-rhamnosyltransferase